MMRAFLDRLLFALPTPSRAGLVRSGLYLLFGLALYGLFLGVLYAREFGEVRLRRWCETLPGVTVTMSRPRLSFLPPALEVDALAVLPRNAAEPLAFRNVRAGLTVFPLGATLEADVAGGGLTAAVIPSALMSPDRLDVSAALDGALAEPLLRPFVAPKGLVQVRSGKLSGTVVLTLPLQNGRPAPALSDGTLDLALRGAVVDLGLPMLKASRLDKLDGKLETGWKKDRLSLRQLELRSPVIACAAQGQVTFVPKDPSASRMDIQAVLRVPPEQLRQELVPERTLRSFKNNGEVRLRLSDTFRRPSLDVQP